MTKRLIAVVDSSDADGPYKARARVYRDTEWDEWRVRYYHGDQLLSYMGEESDSFHGDQADAIGTAEQQVKSLAKQSVPGSRLENPAESGVRPIELRIDKKVQNGIVYYTVDKVYPGVGNVAFGQRKFATLRDASAWCRQEWPNVPVLRN